MQAVRNQIAEAQKIASGSGSEQDIAEAKIELEVGKIPRNTIDRYWYANSSAGSGKSSSCAEINVYISLKCSLRHLDV
jgi:hypothetical protein